MARIGQVSLPTTSMPFGLRSRQEVGTRIMGLINGKPSVKSYSIQGEMGSNSGQRCACTSLVNPNTSHLLSPPAPASASSASRTFPAALSSPPSSSSAPFASTTACCHSSPTSGSGLLSQVLCCGLRSASASTRPVLPQRVSAFSGNPFYSGNQSKTGKKSKAFGDQRQRHFSTGHKMCDKRGYQLLFLADYNKELAFSEKEREALGLKGLLPAAVRSQALQEKAIMANFRTVNTNIGKYMFLRDVQDYNKRLFYRILCDYTEELMPIVYTPVVGEACEKYSTLFKRPRGLFITIHDAGRVSEILENWHEKDVKAIVVTDGERILGLGDQGANGMGIPVGKLALYSALAGIPPQMTLPVTLDVGTNNEKLLNDELYIGLRETRVTGPKYDDLVQEFMEAVVKRWGRSCLIQFEDFGNANAFRLLDRYKKNYCTFNDDIQGTAAVAVAGIIAACKINAMKMSQHTFLFLGAGEAALGTADLLVMAMEADGLSTEAAREHIWLFDSRGLISKDRPTGGLDEHKNKYLKHVPHTMDFESVVDLAKPTTIIGVSAQTGLFTESILRKMATYNKSPIIFPLSNPTSKAECTAEQAFRITEGRCVFASGSPFDPVQVKGKTFVPGQGNNAYIFPGVALAAIECGVHHIPNETFLVAARALAEQVSRDFLDQGRVFPPLSQIREVSLVIAAKVAQYFYVEGLATVRPEPDDKVAFLKSKQYDGTYDGDKMVLQ